MVQNRSDENILEQWVREYENDPEFIAEGLAVEVMEEALEILAERGLKQSWLAQAMGVSRAHVSRMFNAAPNLTLLSIARLAVALDVTPKVLLDSGKWFIRPLDEPINYEDFLTDVATMSAQRLGSSAQDTINAAVGEYQAGALSNAVT